MGDRDEFSRKNGEKRNDKIMGLCWKRIIYKQEVARPEFGPWNNYLKNWTSPYNRWFGNRNVRLTWQGFVLLTTSMTDQAAAKKTLSLLSKREDLNNKICCDCSNPNPQWASLRYHQHLNLTKIAPNQSR